MAQQRTQAGVPSGGQYATSTHAESGIALTPVPLPDWGKELDDRLDEAIYEAIEDLSDGRTQKTVPELLECTNDDLEERYGKDRGRWLAGITVYYYQDTVTTHRAGTAADYDGGSPAEYASAGEVNISDPDDKTITEADFNDEDPPGLGSILSAYPDIPSESKAST